MNKKILSILIFLQIGITAFGQPPSIQWEHCFGYPSGQQPYSIIQTKDNGFLIPGVIDHWPAFTPPGYIGGDGDGWIVRLDSMGTFLWEKFIGGTDAEQLLQAIKTSDGGFIMAGYTISNDVDVSGNHLRFDTIAGVWNRTMDGWVVKLDSLCNIQWQKCYGGSREDRIQSIISTVDGGYIFAGHTNSNDGDVSGYHGTVTGGGATDAWVVKIDSVGNIQWQKCYGGTYMDAASEIKTLPSGYAVFCTSGSNDFDVSNNHGYNDYWLIKIDDNGNIIWQNCYGGTSYDISSYFIINPDNSFLLGGASMSTSLPDHNGDVDLFLVKADSSGNILWQKCYGGSDYDGMSNLILNNDSTIFVCGNSYSNDFDVTGNHPPFFQDIWLFTIDQSGSFIWKQCYGSTDLDNGNYVIPTSDGGYAISAISYGDGGDVSSNIQPLAMGHYWIIKFAPNLTSISENNISKNIKIYPNPSNGNFQIFVSENNYSKFKIEVRNVVGEILYKQETAAFSFSNTFDLNLSNLVNGIYFLDIIIDGSHSIKKFVKE